MSVLRRRFRINLEECRDFKPVSQTSELPLFHENPISEGCCLSVQAERVETYGDQGDICR